MGVEVEVGEEVNQEIVKIEQQLEQQQQTTVGGVERFEGDGGVEVEVGEKVNK